MVPQAGSSRAEALHNLHVLESSLSLLHPLLSLLCSSGWSGTHSVDQTGLRIRDPLSSSSGVLGLKKYTTKSDLPHLFERGFVPHSFKASARAQDKGADRHFPIHGQLPWKCLILLLLAYNITTALFETNLFHVLSPDYPF